MSLIKPLSCVRSGLKLVSALVVAMVLCFAGLAGAGTRLTLSHNQDATTPVHLAMQSMADEVELRTNGELIIRIYPNGQLGSQRESMELMQLGAIDMVKSNASELEAFAPIFGAFNLPYLFLDREHFYRVLKSSFAQDLLSQTAEKGFVGLTYYDGGSRSFYANKAIRKPSDLEGMKIRVQPSASAIAMVRAMGGAPTPLAYTELYTALQQSVVDGAENSVMALTKARHGEVAKIYSRDEHTRIPDALLVSVKTLKRLSEREKQILFDAANNSMWIMKSLWQNAIDQAENKAKEMGVSFVDVDKALFQEAVLAMHKEAEAHPVYGSAVKKIKSIGVLDRE